MIAARAGRAARRLVVLGCLASVACAGDPATPAAAAAPEVSAAAAAPQPTAFQAALEADVAAELRPLYDAASLAGQWSDLKGSAGVAADRALFDVGLSVAAARMLHAVHNGRVDPATMPWGYAIEPKPVDAEALLRDAREGRGLAGLDAGADRQGDAG